MHSNTDRKPAMTANANDHPISLMSNLEGTRAQCDITYCILIIFVYCVLACNTAVNKYIHTFAYHIASGQYII